MNLRFVALLFLFASNISFSQSPGNVASNLRLWLKADTGVTGATPVSGWDDQSGNGYNATVPTNGPDLLANQLNFNPTLDFTSASSEYLQVTGGIFGNSTFNNAWVYTVSRTDNSANTNTIFHETLSGTNQNFDLLLTWNNANTYYDFGDRGGTGRLNGAWGGTNGQYNVWIHGTSTSTSTPNGTRKAISRDGAVILSNNNNDNATGANNDFTIGGRYTGIDNYYLDGQIAVLAIYTGVPSVTEEETIESYFGLKYGISLAHDYYNSGYDGANAASTRVYDYGVGYDNEIIGMIRDDNGAVTMATPYYIGNRIARIYKADDVSKTGAETLVFDNTNITGLVSGTTYYIIVSTDAVFDNTDESQVLTNRSDWSVFL